MIDYPIRVSLIIHCRYLTQSRFLYPFKTKIKESPDALIMVATFLPVLNLLNQFFKQISKPVSFRIVKYAKTHPVFRWYFLILPGRWFHTLDQNVRRRFMLENKENIKFKKSHQVDDETAIEAGANLMSECIIFLIAGLGVLAEVNRNARNSAIKEAIKIDEMKKLIDKKKLISSTVEKHATMISELEKLVNEYIRHTPTTASHENPEK